MKTVNIKKCVKQGHQGDVYFKKLDMGEEEFNAITSSASLINPEEDGATTILEGELTHHHHQFRGSNVVAFKVREERGCQVMLVKIEKPANLEHYHVKNRALTTEHDTIAFDPGIYEFRSQREITLDNVIRPVVD